MPVTKRKSKQSKLSKKGDRKKQKPDIQCKDISNHCFGAFYLPKDSEEEIFSWLDRHHIRLVCPLVCKKWLQMSKNIKVLRSITNNFGWERMAYNVLRVSQNEYIPGYNTPEELVKDLGIAHRLFLHLENKNGNGMNRLKWRGVGGGKWSKSFDEPSGHCISDFTQEERLYLLKLCVSDRSGYEAFEFERMLHMEEPMTGIRPPNPITLRYKFYPLKNIFTGLIKCKLDAKELESIRKYLDAKKPNIATGKYLSADEMVQEIINVLDGTRHYGIFF